jgi:uncharacterized surface protein with fasciclin (FAS1) repeats
MHTFLSGGAFLAVATLVAANPVAGDSKTCGSSARATQVHSGERSIVETAVGAGNFTTLAKALESAKLIDALNGPGPFTVFAPTDEAFAKLPKGTLESLLRPESAETLTSILTYHVVSGDVRAKQVVELTSATSLNGQRIPVAVAKSEVRVAGAKVIKTDIACSNGVIHVIDQVLMPATQDVVSTAVAAKKFTVLAKALEAADLVSALNGKGPFTVFAPTDEAFAQLPKGTLESLLEPGNKDKLVAILKAHVTTGRVYADQLRAGPIATLGGERLTVEFGKSGPTIGGAAVLTADIQASNGVIHVIDRVIVPGA